MRFNGAKTVRCGYKLDSYFDFSREDKIIGGGWHHYVLTYDKTLPRKMDDPETDADDPANKHYRVYFDGQLMGAVAGTNFSANIKYKFNSLWLGIGLENGKKRSWHGFMDDCVVLNRPVTDDEVSALYNLHKTMPSAATGILPVTTDLQVDEGAKAAFDLANETVAAISGSGSIELSPLAKLAVTAEIGFTGEVSGGGKLVLGDSIAWRVPTDDLGSVEAGEYTYFTIPAGMLETYSSERWTISPELGASQRASFKVVDNNDGTVTFCAEVNSLGLRIVVR